MEFGFILLFSLFLRTISVSIIYVNSNSTSSVSNCGFTSNEACPTIYSGFVAALSGDTILIEPGLYSGQGNEGLTSANLTQIAIDIVGNGLQNEVVIQCQRVLGFLNAQNSFLRSISNITISNCSSFGRKTLFTQNGGGLLITDSSRVYLTDVTFKDNLGLEGGAISMTEGALTLLRCTFLNNKARRWGGAIFSADSGLTIFSSVFIGNEASGETIDVTDAGRGGGIYSHAGTRITIEESIFHFNSAKITGGAIYADSSSAIDLQNSHFQENLAYGGEECDGATICTIRGGALYFHDMSAYITNCSFISNKAISGDMTQFAKGGAIAIEMDFFASPNFKAIFDNCTFNDNTAKGFADDYPGGYGGAIYSMEITISIYNSRFIANYVISPGYDNEHISRGGALYIILTPTVNIFHTFFNDNIDHGGDGGAIYLSQSSLQFQFNTFQSNFADSSPLLIARGGALFIDDSTYLILDCFFQHNHAISGHGGAIFLKSSIGQLHRNQFLLNNATSGGGLYFDIDNKLNMTSTIFENNSATYGGGVYFQSNNNNIRISQCQFTGNIVVDSGGCIYLEEANYNLVLQHNIFQSNQAVKFGGVVFLSISNANFQLIESTLIGNSARLAGGVLYSNTNNNMTFYNLKISLSSSRYGGSLFFSANNHNIRIENIQFRQNYGVFGGIYMSQFNSELYLFNCSFISCFGETGVAFTSFADQTIINSCQFSRSSGTVSLASILGDNKMNIKIINSIFDNNNGTIWVTGGSTSIQNTIFQNNSGDLGGILLITNSIYSLIENCTFHNNTANYGGGAYFNAISQLFIINTLFITNYASISGGSLFLSLISQLHLNHNQFIHNKGKSNGGAIDLSNCHGMFAHNLFKSNIVELVGGSSLMLSYNNITFQYNNFSHNIAIYGGGTVYWNTKTMKEPIDLTNSTLNTFIDNTALYGTQLATEEISITTQSKLFNITQYGIQIPSILVTLIDYYNHTIATDSLTNIELIFIESYYCSEYPLSVIGSKSVKLKNGVANFTDLFIYCSPGDSVPLQFRAITPNHILKTNASLYFRRCQIGEYSSGQECILCETGTYSLYENHENLDQISVCKTCPDHTITCYGSTINLKSGYWRISSQSSHILSCPYGSNSCQGGETTGDESCHLGYEGPLCAVCSTGYGFQSPTKTCIRCSNSSSQFDIISILFIILILILLILLCYSYFSRNIRNKIKSFDDLLIYFINILQIHKMKTFSTQQEVINFIKIITTRIKARMKVYITMYQILSCLPFVLDLSFPYPVNRIISLFNIFNISISQSSTISCSNYSFDFIEIVIFDTILPLLILLFLSCCQGIHLTFIQNSSQNQSSILLQQINEKRNKISSYYFTIQLMYIYFILPSLTNKIFQLFNCKNIDPNNLNSGEDIYLTVDYSISCTSTKYYFAFYYGIIMVFIYPIGFPCYFFLLLWKYRDEIQINIQNNSTMTIEGMETMKPSEGHQHVSPSPSPSQQSYYLNSFSFLYSSYKSYYWWWEILEIYQRITLAGILVLISPGLPLQIIIGSMLTLVFIYLHVKHKPYHDSVILSIKILSYWQIYFVFWIALLIKSNFSSISNMSLGVSLIFVIFANFMNDLFKLMMTILISQKVFQQFQQYFVNFNKNSFNETNNYEMEEVKEQKEKSQQICHENIEFISPLYHKKN